MSLGTILVGGGIAFLFVLLAGLLMRVEARARGDVAPQPSVKVRQARFPRSIR
jgi:hypothetical protein